MGSFRVGLRCFLKMLHALVRLRGPRPDVEFTADQLAGVTQLSLLVLGVDDPMGSRSDSERLARAVPQTQIHVVDDGHAPWLHHTDQIAPLVNDFLGVVHSRNE